MRLPGILVKKTGIPRPRINASNMKYPATIISSAEIAATATDINELFFLTMYPARKPISAFIISVAKAYWGYPRESARHEPNPPAIAPETGPSKNAESNNTASPALI